MKLKAVIGNDEFGIEMVTDLDRLRAAIDGREYDLEFSEPEPGVFLFKHHGRITEAAVIAEEPGSGRFRVIIRGRETEVRIVDPKRLRGTSTGSQDTAGLALIVSAMPGKVVQVLLEPEVEVKQGDGIVVVEAMKMQNELRSPKSGILREIRVVSGQTVAAGEVLAVID